MSNPAGDTAQFGALVGLLASRTPGLDREGYIRAMTLGGGFGRVLEATRDDAVFGPLREALEDGAVARAAAEALARWAGEGIRCLPLGGAEYPPALHHIPDPPLILFVRGENVELLRAKPGLGIVGSRRADPVGCSIAFDAARAMAERGVVVVSGLALGIDGAAHRGAISSHEFGATVAVFGAGLHTVYPAMHRELARQILASGGLLVSQFEPEARPFPANFLNRNRVIAGLSEAVLVVQAAERSGALVTARCALEAGRELMAVPGSIRDPLYGGSNRLLRTGAVVVTAVEDIYDSFPGPLRPLRNEHPGVSSKGEAEKPSGLELETPEGGAEILEALEGSEPIHLEVLLSRVPEVPTIHADLLALELSGRVARLPGNYLQRIR